MRLLVLTVLFACSFLPLAAQLSPDFHEATAPSLPSGGTGSVLLKLDDAKLTRGRRYRVEYTFRNTSGGYWVYNCFFNGLIPLPGELAIYDSTRQYIGDLIRWEVGSRRFVENDDWVFLREDDHVGTTIDFTAGYVPGTRYGTLNTLLPAGEYYIQLILYKAFLSTPTSDQSAFYRTFDGSEAIRSNVIRVEIVD